MIVEDETDVEIQLGQWFEDNNIEFYYNRKISRINNSNVFHITGTKRKPDMLINHPTYPICGYIALEIKDANKSRNISDATKILNYGKDYLSKKTLYFVNEKEIEIRIIAVATQFSPLGMIHREKEPTKSNTSEWNRKYQTHPLIEFPITHRYVRDIWGFHRVFRAKNKVPQPGYGILLSDRLDIIDNNLKIDTLKFRPKLFYQIFLFRGWKMRWTAL